MKSITTSIRRAVRRPAPRTSLSIAFALLMIMGNLFSPMLSSAAAEIVANDARLDQLQAEQLQPMQTETPSEEEGEATETSETTENLTIAEEQVANVTVNLYWCDAGSNVDTVDLSSPAARTEMQTDCNQQGSAISTTLTSASNPANTSSQNTSVFPGAVFISDLPQDTYLLTINTTNLAKQGFFCETYGNQGNTKPYARYAFAQQGFTLDTTGDVLNIFCDWFGEPTNTAQDTGTNVTFYKWQCPDGTLQGQGKTYYESECATEQAGVPFQVTDDNGTQDTTSDTNGRQIDNLQGEITLKELVPQGYGNPAIFCQLLNDAQSTDNSNTSPSVTLQPNADDDYQCWFYNIPGTETGGSGDVIVYKYACASIPPANSDYSWYFQNCTTAQNGVTFVLDTPAVDIQTNTGDSISGAVQMGGVEVGTYPLTETVPLPNFETGAVFCATVGMNVQPGPGDFQSQNVVSNGITATVTANSVFFCNWYNVPTDGGDGTSVTIYKWECPSGTLAGQASDYYSAECATEQAGVPFQVTDDNGTQDTTSDTNGRQIDNLMGVITIKELIPDGYGVPMVFCQLLNDPAPTLMTVTDGAITLQPNATDDYQCWFYNIPQTPTSVTIYKWECPAGTLTGQAADYYSAECATEQPGVPFQVTDDTGTQDTTSDTNGRQIDNLYGEITIREIIPAGFGTPVVFCQLLNDPAPTVMTVADGAITLQPSATDSYQCWFYNIPDTPSTIVIFKWRCPDGMPAEMTQNWFQTNCTTSQDGVEFNLTDSAGTRAQTTTGGKVTWNDVHTGPVQVAETVPPGFYPNPFVVCTVQNDANDTDVLVTINGVWNTTIPHGGITIVCDWYNWYMGPGDITVYKWTCPEGYDRTAWGADPMVDCTQATNGVTFKLDQPNPGIDLFSDTGDSIDGAVYFGGLEPGSYTISEMLDPSMPMQDIFVWQCTGLNSGAVQPRPLSVGQDLNFSIVGGDKIVCHWFNVPYPELGWIVVSKFNCTTEKYVADVYCYTNQTGQAFNLQMWQGGTGWTTVASGITDVSGKLTFADLEPGAYRLIEPDAQACMMKSSNITSGGFIGVNKGEGTTVYVYNCKTPPPPTKTPTKYPNTGVGPSLQGEQHQAPGIALGGLVGLLGLHMTRRRMVVGAGLAAAASLPLAAQELQPLTSDSTPLTGTPEPAVFGCEGTPAAWTQVEGTPAAGSTPTVDPCDRGAIPIQMRIPVINVDAPIEYLEIIDGVMQQPTDDTHITWYKETSRLGEVGNGIYAAHLNWWGNPEGIFFRLESLQAGDVVEIDGIDQQTHLYVVQWMQNFPSNEEPPEEALGLTDEAAITLVTCGGEWSSALSEYDHRTLVRAVLRE